MLTLHVTGIPRCRRTGHHISSHATSAGQAVHDSFGILERKCPGIAPVLSHQWLNMPCLFQILDFVSSHFLLYDADVGRNQSFDEFCGGFCQANEPVRQFYVSSALAFGDNPLRAETFSRTECAFWQRIRASISRTGSISLIPRPRCSRGASVCW